MNDQSLAEQNIAFGHPGSPPKWTSSSKEAIGTAYSVSSHVWFTLSHGILNEVYYPTIDRPQIRDLQFMIADGESLFHTEQRDLDTELQSLADNVLGYRVVNKDRKGRYRIVKEIITDPHLSCVIINGRLEGDEAFVRRLNLYVLLAPHLQGGGAGNSAKRMRSVGRDVLVAWKGATWLALGARPGFLKTSCGFVGASDGWQDLNDNHNMDWSFDRAEDGNIAMTGQIDLSKARDFTVVLAMGNSLHSALTKLHQTLAKPFADHESRFIEQWHRVCHDLTPHDQVSHDHGKLYRSSRSLLLAHEDKLFPGGLIASASIPWGQAKGDEDLGGYHLVWTRDSVQSAMALLACGNQTTPLRTLVYLACAQQPDGGFPQNFWINGTPYWHAVQMDEVAFPIILAWRLWQEKALQDFDPYPMVKNAAAFLISHGPATQQDRWEENSGYSPSTLAATIAGLICAAAFMRDRGDVEVAQFVEEYADFLESHIERWTVTTKGTLLPGVPRHYVRIGPTNPDDPTPHEDPDTGVVPIRNRAPEEQQEFPAREIVDAGFLELVRYGIRAPGDPLVEDSLRVVDAVLKVDTPYGPCWRRYNHDGYGEREDGSPFTGYGKGRAWPLFTGERGHYELACGRDADLYLASMERFASGTGLMPEQVWDEADLPSASMYFGRPAGSAMPLMWAHAEYIKLVRSIFDQKVFDRISIVADRYLNGNGRKDFELWKHTRRVERVFAGQILRIESKEPFRLHWSSDHWLHSNDTASTDSGLGLAFADIAVDPAQSEPIRFTFFWPGRQQWEGKDYSIAVIAEQPASSPPEENGTASTAGPVRMTVKS